MRYSSTFAVLAAATFSLAQQTSDIPKYKSSLNITIDPNSVDEQQRWSWCNAQYNTCRTLCDNDTKNNECEQSDLSYDCQCSSNSSAPGLQYYTQTMPTFICKAAFEQCTLNHSTQKEHDLCDSNINEQCATQDPPAPKKGSKDDSSKDDSSEDDSSEDDSSETETKTESEESSTTTEASKETSASSSEEKVTSDTSDGFAAPTMVPGGNVAAVAALGVLAYLV